MYRALGILLVALVAALPAACGGDEGPEVGLITKTGTNPFFVRQGVGPMTATGRFDGDNARAGELAGEYARSAMGGDPPSGYTDTGLTLITDEPQSGVESRDPRYGLNNCWGQASRLRRSECAVPFPTPKGLKTSVPKDLLDASSWRV